MRGLYVETLVRADLDRVWELTRDPRLHQRWDLRFTTIDPVLDTEPQRFRYATRVLPGLRIGGTGTTVGDRTRPDGTRTSTLRFSSGHPLSPIVAGAGYWRYVPSGGGVRFLTGYDHTPRHRVVDRVFRPLMGWGTAWSFDRLRLWAERGTTPEASLRTTALDVAWRLAATAAVAGFSPPAALVAGVAVALIPPSPGTPAARRCLRTPPDRFSATAPAALARLEQR